MTLSTNEVPIGTATFSSAAHEAQTPSSPAVFHVTDVRPTSRFARRARRFLSTSLRCQRPRDRALPGSSVRRIPRRRAGQGARLPFRRIAADDADPVHVHGLHMAAAAAASPVDAIAARLAHGLGRPNVPGIDGHRRGRARRRDEVHPARLVEFACGRRGDRRARLRVVDRHRRARFKNGDRDD